MSLEKQDIPETFPVNEDLERFAPTYTAEVFSEEERKLLSPFFTNLDQPVFIIRNLPQEVMAALCSRYSRAVGGLRRIFLDEYLKPIVDPELQRDWLGLDEGAKKERLALKDGLGKYIAYLNENGGLDQVANVQRGRQFFEKWLGGFGDDSIAELGGVHLCIEGLSNIATKEIEDIRIGISPIEKSSRYVSFAERNSDGSFKFVIPGEIKGTEYEAEYCRVMDLLFITYSFLQDKYFEYVCELYPKGEDETDSSFRGSRSAKRFDDLRDLLPFSTQTNVALVGNGRAFENLINKLLASKLGELHYWGQQIYQEVSRVTPSLVSRVATVRGAEVQQYRRKMHFLQEEMSNGLLNGGEKIDELSVQRVHLLDYDRDADVRILTAFLFSQANLSLDEVCAQVKRMSYGDRQQALALMVEKRNLGKNNPDRQEVRFRKVPRAFEVARLWFSLVLRGGDFRDLQRHRMLTQDKQSYNTLLGYELEDDVLKSPFKELFKVVLNEADGLYCRLTREVSREVAQYTVPYAFLQHIFMCMNARELFWMLELRTGQQGKGSYRRICQEMARQAQKALPSVFQGLCIDWHDYPLSRRESEKRGNQKG